MKINNELAREHHNLYVIASRKGDQEGKDKYRKGHNAYCNLRYHKNPKAKEYIIKKNKEAREKDPLKFKLYYQQYWLKKKQKLQK